MSDNIGLLQQLLTWIGAHPHWAGLIVFTIAFTEALAFGGIAILTRLGSLNVGIYAESKKLLLAQKAVFQPPVFAAECGRYRSMAGDFPSENP